MTAEASQRLLDLGESTRALELGDWPRILSSRCWAASLDGSVGSSELAAIHRLLAYSMRCQAVGDPARAWRQLGHAAQRLPRTLQRPGATSGDGCRLVVLCPAPTQPGLPMLVWATARIIWREQRELVCLRSQFLRGRAEPRGNLIDAGVEHLRWVECDPFAWRARADVTVDRRRADLLRRADQLRRFADPRSPDIGVTVWRTVGGYGGLRAAAMLRLLESELVPWSDALGIPVRRGRACALRAARAWIADLEY
ncbi:MAG: hypothetical protein H0V92_04295 [Pseudonocardiales bacterium]|nr:hypothetical protein [Pseudonocardiales bacterium]